MKAVVAAFNQEKALVGAFSVITNLRMELLQALMEVINGEDYFTSFIWTPNIFIENGRESTLMRTTGDSSYVRIFHTGEVELTRAN